MVTGTVFQENYDKRKKGKIVAEKRENQQEKNRGNKLFTNKIDKGFYFNASLLNISLTFKRS